MKNETIANHQATGAKKITKKIRTRINHDITELKKEAEKFTVGSPNRCRLDGWVQSNEEVLAMLELLEHQFD